MIGCGVVVFGERMIPQPSTQGCLFLMQVFICSLRLVLVLEYGCSISLAVEALFVNWKAHCLPDLYVIHMMDDMKGREVLERKFAITQK
jgi:hypothetical protein